MYFAFAPSPPPCQVLSDPQTRATYDAWAKQLKYRRARHVAGPHRTLKRGRRVAGLG